MRTIIIISFLLLNKASAQIKFGTYHFNSPSGNSILDSGFSYLSFDKDSTFIYQSRTSLGCLLWFDISGYWTIKNDLLILTDITEAISGRIRLMSDSNKHIDDKAYKISTNSIQRQTIFKIDQSGLNLFFVKEEYDFSKGVAIRSIRANFIFDSPSILISSTKIITKVPKLNVSNPPSSTSTSPSSLQAPHR